MDPQNNPKGMAQVRHLAGLAALMDWRSRWDNVRNAITQEGDVLVLGVMPTSRFAIGLPRHRHLGRYPVLLVQSDEAEWLSLINWERVHLQDGRLSLVSRRQISAGGDLPDLPAFAVSLSLDGPLLDIPLHQATKLEIRTYWNDQGAWQVDGGPPLRELPLSPPGAPLFAAQDRIIGETFQDKVRKHSANLSTRQPVFRGERPDLSGWSDDFILKTSPLPPPEA